MQSQVLNVLHKNWLLKKRAKCMTLFELLVPLLIVGGIVLGFALAPREQILANNYKEVRVWPDSSSGLEFNVSTPANGLQQQLQQLISQLNVSSTQQALSASEALTLLLSNDPEAGAEIIQSLFDGALAGPQPEESMFTAQQLTAPAVAQGLLKNYTGQNITDLQNESLGLLANYSTLLASASTLCDVFDLCLAVKTPQSIGDLFGKDLLKDALQGVLPIIPFDAFVTIQKIAEVQVSDTIKKAAVYIPWIENAIKRRKLAFAPDTPEVRTLVRSLNATHLYFGETFYTIFPTEKAALQWVLSDGVDQLWALIVVSKVDIKAEAFEYTIRMNQSATPDTRYAIQRLSKGRDKYYQQYMATGFMSLQQMMDGYFLSLAGDKALGSSCPVQYPAIVLDGTAQPITQLRGSALNGTSQRLLGGLQFSPSPKLPLQIPRQLLPSQLKLPSDLQQVSWIPGQVLQDLEQVLQSNGQVLQGADQVLQDAQQMQQGSTQALLEEQLITALGALLSRLPPNITAIFPGLRDSNTGKIDPTAVQRLFRGLNSPATATSLVLPVLDFDQNLFFLFGASFIGIVGVYAYLFPLSVAVRTITQEKELRIKQGMLIMGLSHGALFGSWVITNTIIALIISISLTVEMKFTYLRAADFSLLLVLQILFGLNIVAFGLMCSTLFSKARNAAIVGPLLLFVCSIPTFAANDCTPLEKAFISLLSPVAYAWAMDRVAAFEYVGIGIRWGDVTEGGVFNVAIGMGMLAFDTALYLFLAWYGDQVLPSAFGVQRSCCFCLPRCIRNLFSRREPEGTYMTDIVSTALVEEHEAKAPPGICIMNLRKVFKTFFSPPFIAVDGLSLNMFENQINVLLGHNGAGKTTTINMMTGILPPTSGDCLVYGMSIRNQMLKIRKSLGLCPQHDILWATLSVAEHLRFYARLKGMASAEVEDAVQVTLRDIGLEDKAHCWSCALSGGMKRRLSVGISLIGGSKVVFLDEPTSGMDPAARRQTWDLLRKAKIGRVLVLTTHFMDEADILGDTISIMSKGRLRCSGSPLFLKSRLGVGYNLTFDLTKSPDRTSIRNTIFTWSPGATPLSEVAGECSFKLPMSDSSHFPALFQELEEHGPQWGILSFGLSLTTIEEVFLKVANESHEAEPPKLPAQPLFIHLPSPSWIKNRLTPKLLEGRHICVEPCPQEPVVPGVLKREMRDLKVPIGSPSHQPLIINLPAMSPLLCASNFDLAPTSSSEADSIPPLSPSHLTFIHSGKVSPCNALHHAEEQKSIPTSGLRLKGTPPTGIWLFVEQVHISLKKRLECAIRDKKTLFLQTMLPLITITVALLALSIPNPQRPKLELNVKSYRQSLPPEVLVRSCGWEDDEDHWGDDFTLDVKDMKHSAELSNYAMQTFFKHISSGYRAGGVLYKDIVLYLQLWNSTTPSPQSMAKSVLPKSQSSTTSPPLSLDMSAPRIPIHATTFLHNATALHGLPVQYNALNQARLRKRTGRPSATIHVANHPLPLTQRQLQRYDSVITVIAAIFVLIPFTFFPANCVAFIVKEREVRAKHLQMLCGLRPAAYWVSCYIFDNVNMLLTIFLTLMMFAIFGRREIVGTGELFGAALLLFVLYGFASIALGYLASFAFNNHSLAQNVLMMLNFLFGFVLVLVSQVMNSMYSTRWINESLQKFYRLIPGYCLGEGIIRLSTKPILEFMRGVEYSIFDFEMIGIDLVYMGVMTPILFGCVLFIDSELRRSLQHEMVRFCMWIWRYLSKTCTSKADTNGVEGAAILDEDDDVAQERIHVECGDGRDGDKVTIQRLCKVYPKKGNAPPKKAVVNLSLGVPADEIFALLGSNGAGKTTTLSMMSGEFPPSSGRILLNGFDIVKQRREAQNNIGYCPQFDALIDHLSVNGHLQLYGRLRGIPPSQLNDVAMEILDYLGLTPHQHKMSMSLSGGNKRKLSIGIAIIGSPDVLFFDEPSSGLDPVSRRSLWTCISSLASNRSIILTTHHLEEVDALAHRVTVMAHGQMRGLGTLQHLKSKFGNGYILQFRMAMEHQRALQQYLTKHFPNIQLEEEDWGRLRFHLSDESEGHPVRMSHIFGTIQEVVSDFAIEDYSVSQTTLQDVFLRLTSEAKVSSLGPEQSSSDLHQKLQCQDSSCVDAV